MLGFFLLLLFCFVFGFIFIYFLGIYFLSELTNQRGELSAYCECLMQPREFQDMENFGSGVIWKSAAERPNLFCFHFKNEMKNSS